MTMPVPSPIKIETKRMVRGAEREYEQWLGDYKASGGVYFPYSVEVNIKGSQNRQKYTYDKIETNIPLADSSFARPGTNVIPSAAEREEPGRGKGTTTPPAPPRSLAVSAARDDTQFGYAALSAQRR